MSEQPEVLSSEPAAESAAPARSRKRAAIAGIALVGVGGLAGGIAATASSAGASSAGPVASTPSPVPTGQPARPGHGFGPGFGGGLLGIGGRIEHGSAVVKDRAGTTKTVDLQNGKVTAVSDTALTVKSDDGFSQSYVVVAATRVTKDWQGSTASSIKTGDTVMVIATETGGQHQATLIADGVGGPRGHGAFKHFGDRGPRPGMPVPPPGAPAAPNA